MPSSAVSFKYQVVIPKEILERLGIKPGQRVEVIPYEGRIELVPISAIEESRGFLKGIDSEIERELDRPSASSFGVRPDGPRRVVS